MLVKRPHIPRTATASALGWTLAALLGFLAVAFVPSLVLGEGLLWSRPAPEIPQHIAMGAAFLGFAFYLRSAMPHGRSVVFAAAVGLGCFVAAYGLLLALPDVKSSRAVFALSTVLGLTLALAPFLGWALRALAATAVAAAFIGGALRVTTDSGARAPVRSVNTALEEIVAVDVPGLAGPVPISGGGIEPYGDGFLLATGDGRLFRLSWKADGRSLDSVRLPFDAPMQRDAFVADHASMVPAPMYRVTDMIVDRSTRPPRLLLAHQYWHREHRCFTLRVSASALTESREASAVQWQTLFETQPCLQRSSGFDDLESGGRMAWDAAGRLLLTTGDHGFDSRSGGPALAQRTDGDYGKVLRLDLAGGREVVSIGHRNPQGLAVAQDGRVWLTEHGPQGGDEINVIVEGANYGWPAATYGTQYGTHRWPLGSDRRDHGGYHEPAQAFVPAIAISSLIEVRSEYFPAWQGDLLVASLRGTGLYRVRVRGPQVVYVEPIPLRKRVRDLAQGSDGRILLWQDGGLVSVLQRAESPSEEEAVFAACAWCHEAAADASIYAPPLRGIVGRRVAAMKGFSYSAAMQAAGGHWTEERLDGFLRDPQAAMPGTSMKYPGVPDADERARLIRYLASRR